MITMLMNFGYTKGNSNNEYVKNNWTIRFDSESIEAFNDPDKEEGIYFIGPINKIDLKQLLEDIDEHIY